MAVKKTWQQKIDECKKPIVKNNTKSFAYIPHGSTMLVSSPKEIENYVSQIAYGKTIDIATLRNDLAFQAETQYTCPLTAGIFLRIVAEAHYEKYLKNPDDKSIVPFWRAIDARSSLAKKLSCRADFIKLQQQKEI